MNTYYPGNKNNVSGVYTGVKWQCVEFVRRYFYTIFGVSPNGGDALNWYANAPSIGLERYPNGSLLLDDAGTVWVVENGKKHGITSATAFQNMGYDRGRVVTVQSDVFNNIGEVGPPIDDSKTYQCQPY